MGVTMQPPKAHFGPKEIGAIRTYLDALLAEVTQDEARFQAYVALDRNEWTVGQANWFTHRRQAIAWALTRTGSANQTVNRRLLKLTKEIYET